MSQPMSLTLSILMPLTMLNRAAHSKSCRVFPESILIDYSKARTPVATNYSRQCSRCYTINSRIFSQVQVQSSFLGAESSYLAKLVYCMPRCMHDERDLHYPAWRYVGMQENPSLSGRIPPKSGWLDSLDTLDLKLWPFKVSQCLHRKPCTCNVCP